jgi:hypothetical protein
VKEVESKGVKDLNATRGTTKFNKGDEPRK